MTKQSKGNRVALITGANKGIGLEIARQLGRRDITILIGARDEGRGQEAASRLRDEDAGYRTVEQGAAVAVRLATLEADGPTGGFFDEPGALPW